MDLWQLHDWYTCWRFSIMRPLTAFSQFSNQTNQTMFKFSQMLQKSKSCTVWIVRAIRSQNCSQKSFLCGVIPLPLFKSLSLFCHDDPITFSPDILSARGEQCPALGTRGPAGSASTLLPRKSAPWDAGCWLHPACSSAWKGMLFLSHLRVHITGGPDSIQWEYAENSLEGRSMRWDTEASGFTEPSLKSRGQVSSTRSKVILLDLISLSFEG